MDPADKRVYTEDWRSFLEATRPDIVHFQHALFLGYDMIRETRRTLPDAAIVYTLHEFLPICHHGGQMVRTKTYELCDAASPRRCHDCFPQFPAQTFFLRERFIKSAFELVDMFIAPSENERNRFVEWGIPPEKIRCENYGRFPVQPFPDPPDAGRRRRIGFFGRITQTKGIDVLLEAMKILRAPGRGGAADCCGPRASTSSTPSSASGSNSCCRRPPPRSGSPGSYEQSELPGLMSSVDWVVVPSIWWETGPLVIHEAMMHRRPVICSDIGSWWSGSRTASTDCTSASATRQPRRDDPQGRRAHPNCGTSSEPRSPNPTRCTIISRSSSSIYRQLLDSASTTQLHDRRRTR